MKHVTHEPKGLEGSPCVGMELRRGYIKCPNETYHEVIKRQGNILVKKKTGIYKENGPLEDDRSIQIVLVKLQ